MSEDDLESQISKNEESISICRGFIIKTTIIAIIIIFGIYYLMGEFYYLSWIIGVAGCIDLYFLYKVYSYRVGKKLMVNAINKYRENKNKQEKEKKELIKQLNEKCDSVDKKIKSRFDELEKDKEFEKLHTLHQYAKNLLFPELREYHRSLNLEEFYDFRIKHYNKDFERLFKRLEFYIEDISEGDILGEGLVTEYEEFIENILDEDYVSINLDFYDMDEDYEFRRKNDIVNSRTGDLKDRAIIRDILGIESYNNTRYYRI